MGRGREGGRERVGVKIYLDNFQLAESLPPSCIHVYALRWLAREW